MTKNAFTELPRKSMYAVPSVIFQQWKTVPRHLQDLPGNDPSPAPTQEIRIFSIDLEPDPWLGYRQMIPLKNPAALFPNRDS